MGRRGAWVSNRRPYLVQVSDVRYLVFIWAVIFDSVDEVALAVEGHLHRGLCGCPSHLHLPCDNSSK